MNSQEYIIETQCGYFCEPVELKIVEGKKVYHGYIDVPKEIATTYPDKPAALRAIDKFNIQKSVRGIVAGSTNGQHRSPARLPVRTNSQVLSWKKDS